MSLTAGMAVEQERAKNQRHQEQETLQMIAAITSPEFAEHAADTLDSKKHSYSFGVYLILLKRLQELINVGVPNYSALEAVQTGMTTETLRNVYDLVLGN